MIEAAVWMARWRPGRSKMTGTQVHCRSLCVNCWRTSLFLVLFLFQGLLRSSQKLPTLADDVET